MEAHLVNESILTPKKFNQKICKYGKKVRNNIVKSVRIGFIITLMTMFKVVALMKLLPDFRNVSRQNCETLWNTDDRGK